MTAPLDQQDAAIARHAAIGLGCSLGDRFGRLEGTVRKLAAHPDLRLIRCSRWFRTPPMRGGTATGWFLNGVVRVETTLTGPALLTLCRDLETAAGRRRARFWGDRTLDLDVLLLDGVVVDSDDLTLPHPAIAQRPFVITPLLEIWPDAVNPRSSRLYRDTMDPRGPRAIPWPQHGDAPPRTMDVGVAARSGRRY